MDNLTHTLTGLMLSRAGLDRWHPRAALVLMLSANAPDLDIVSGAGGAVCYMQYHRWYTHSVVMLPLMALLCALLVCLFARSLRHFRQAWLLSLVGVGSHLLLDWTNSYGIRLLLPFSPRWFALDLFNIVDVWIWAVLLLGVAAPLISGLVSSEMGARAGRGRGIAIFALLFVMLYAGARYALHERAIAVLQSRIYQGAAPRRVGAIPGAANPFAWRGVVESANAVSVHRVNLLSEFDPDAGQREYQAEESPALDAARATREFQVMEDFDQYPLLRATPEGGKERGTRVELLDLRYPFVATAIVDETNRVRRAWLRF